MAIPVLVLVSAAVFALASYSPFDPLASYLGDRYETASLAERERLAAELGMNEPWPAQYARWIGDVVSGELGTARTFGQPVGQVIIERLPWTMLLVTVAMVMAVALALVVGVWAAWHQGGLLDRVATGCALALQGVPPFVVALGAIAIFGLALAWLPIAGLTDAGTQLSVAQVANHLVLPAGVLAISQTPWLLLHVRQSLLAAFSEDYVTGARARGTPESWVVLRHALPAALLPFVSLVGVRLPELVTGAVLVEEVFSWPGVAGAVVEAAIGLDFPLLAILTLLATVTVLLGSLLADVAYVVLDPRVRADG